MEQLAGTLITIGLMIAFAVGEYLRHDGNKRMEQEAKKEPLVYQQWFGFGLMVVSGYGMVDIGFFVPSPFLAILGTLASIYLTFCLLKSTPRLPHQ